MTTFTIITGLVTLTGFFLQIRGMYPEYRRYYAPATLFFLGLTIGFTLSSITGTSIFLPESISAKNIFGFALYGGTGLLIFLCFAASIFVEDQTRRSELSKIGSTVSGFFIFILIAFTSTFFPGPDKNNLSYDEQLALVTKAVERKDYDRALKLIEDEKRYLDRKDPRIEGLDRMITDVHKLQMAVPVLPPQLNSDLAGQSSSKTSSK